MIRDDKMNHALCALNFILTRARFIAGKSNHAVLEELLDYAEILPKYIAEEKDRTEDFRTALTGIAERCPMCSHVVPMFDEDEIGEW